MQNKECVFKANAYDYKNLFACQSEQLRTKPWKIRELEIKLIVEAILDND